eukprot:4630031-Amphidinium_carterae.1
MRTECVRKGTGAVSAYGMPFHAVSGPASDPQACSNPSMLKTCHDTLVEGEQSMRECMVEIFKSVAGLVALA